MSNRSKQKSVCRPLISELGSSVAIACISGCIGGLVAMPFILFNHSPFLPNALKAGAMGFIIGVASRAVFAMIFRIIHSNPSWAFASVFLVIGAGTVGGSLFWGLFVPLQLLLITCIAEIIGLGFCMLLYRYSNALNEGLRHTQESIESE